MKKIICFTIAMIFILLCFISCTQKSQTNEIIWSGELNSLKIEKMSASMSNIGFDEKLLSYIAEHKSGNYMVSPLSFRYALSLLLAGAEGDTKAELLSALGVNSLEEWNNYCYAFNGFVNLFEEELKEDIERYKRDMEKGYIDKNEKEPFRALRVANSVWKAERITAPFKSAYTESISKNYGAEFCSFNKDNVVSLVNDWVSKKTEKMITKLLPDNYDTTALTVILMNALYFKDSWVKDFSDGLTEEADFTSENGTVVKKTFMTQTEDFLCYYDTNTQLVILPMDGNVYMAFVIGDTENLSEKISMSKEHSVKVTIPKLDLETSFDNGEFVNFLKENGVNKAFTSAADFSGMIDHEIFISDIIQKTRLKLDEKGAEAAAVTAIMMKDAAFTEPDEPFEFNANKPFSFYIYSTVNDVTAIMFAGEIVE